MSNQNFRKFSSKLQGQQMALRFHVCIDCRHNQKEIFETCPKCGCENRVYFPSKSEFHRAMTLLMLQDQGVISELEFHPRFPLIVEGEKVTTYVADSRYRRDGKKIVEDDKPQYFIDNYAKLKMKIYEVLYKDKIYVPKRNSGGI